MSASLARGAGGAQRPSPDLHTVPPNPAHRALPDGVWLPAGYQVGVAYLRGHDPDAAQPNIADPLFLSIHVFAGLALALPGRIVRVLHSIGDIALLAPAAVLVRSGRGARRGGSAPLLLVGTMLFLAGDMIWLVVGTLGVELNPALNGDRGRPDRLRRYALYAAKAAGRDRIESAGLRPTPETTRPNGP